MTDLENYRPWAVVAGGSEGVGAEFAKQLAAAGRNVVLLARRPDPLEATADECYIAGGNGDDVERRNDPDRAKVVLGTHRFMQKLIGGNSS